MLALLVGFVVPAAPAAAVSLTLSFSAQDTAEPGAASSWDPAGAGGPPEEQVGSGELAPSESEPSRALTPEEIEQAEQLILRANPPLPPVPTEAVHPDPYPDRPPARPPETSPGG